MGPRRAPCRPGLLSAALLLAAAAARAEPSVPWNPSAAARHDIELLVDEAGLDLTVSQWPLPSAAVRRAIERLPGILPAPLQQARDRVGTALDRAAGSQLTWSVRDNAEALAGYGDDATRGSSLALRSTTLVGGPFAAQVGARVETDSGLRGDRKLRLDDTALVAEAYGLQAQAFAHRSWWGPGWQTSLALSNNAPAFAGIGLQRAGGSRSESPWLAWLGPWTYDMFLAQTEDVTQPANPYLFGQRLTFKPFGHLELGLTRTAQWGGRGRPQGAKSFLHLLTGNGVNADTAAQQASDAANELAGFDARLRCPDGVSCAAYLQLIGEDMAGSLPSHYLGLYGIESWSTDGRQRYYAEYAETGCSTPIGAPAIKGCAYRNFAYPQGYVSAGRWIGSSAGPDSRLLTLGWLDAQAGAAVRVHVGRVGSRIGTYSAAVEDPASSGRLLGLAASQRFDWGGATLTPELELTHVASPAGGSTQARIGATLQFDLEAQTTQLMARPGPSSVATLVDQHPLVFSLGLVAASTLLDRAADHYALAHAQNPSGKTIGHLGSAVPIVATGLAGTSWLVQRGTEQGDVAWSALFAGASALAVAELGKYATARARPEDGLGPGSFGTTSRAQSAFPSIHTAVAWAVLTPYAKHYDAPWLYGLAALTNVGRVAGRNHWVSDTVAGSALGYALGSYSYERSSAAARPKDARWWITPQSLRFELPFD